MRWERLNLDIGLRGTSEGRKSAERVSENLGPGKRWGHTCNSVKGGIFVYVFGGYGQDNCQTNDVHVFDTIRQTWSKPLVKGDPPSPRDSHSCTTVGNNLFVFGGTDGKDPLKDLHILDTSSHTWISPTLQGEGPEAREGHSAALVGKQLYIFGGCGKVSDDSEEIQYNNSEEIHYNNSEEIYYNDLYILDTETLVWRRALTSGTPPCPRDSHSCSSWRHTLIVIGGEDASDYFLSDVHILDTDTLVWRELSSSCWILPPRAGHSTVALGQNLFVFGGFADDRNLYDDLHMLNLDTGTWTKMLALGEAPSARFSVAGDCLDSKRGILVFIGGCNVELEALDDIYYLHTEMSVEFEPSEKSQEKFSIKKELKRKCQEKYLPISLPLKDEDEHKLGTHPKMCQSMPLPCYGQPEIKQKLRACDFKPSQEKIFEAKVTEAFHYGYTIETNINGKALHGVLFSYKPGFAHSANSYLSSFRKKKGKTTNGIEDVCKPKSEHANGQQDAFHGKKSTLQESPVETTMDFESNNSMPAGVTQLHTQVHGISRLSKPLQGAKDEGTNEQSNSSREIPSENTSFTTKEIS